MTDEQTKARKLVEAEAKGPYVFKESGSDSEQSIKDFKQSCGEEGSFLDSVDQYEKVKDRRQNNLKNIGRIINRLQMKGNHH